MTLEGNIFFTLSKLFELTMFLQSSPIKMPYMAKQISYYA